MIKHLSFFLVLGLILTACNKNEAIIPECNVENPLEELAWLNDIKIYLDEGDCVCTQSIFEGKYKEKTVFFVLLSDPLCDGIFNAALRDCNGEVVKHYGEGESNLFAEEVEITENLYECSE